MEPLAKKELVRLVHLIFDDLLDDCAIGEKRLKNGSKLAARQLMKDAIRIRKECLDELKQSKSAGSSPEELKKFRSLSNNIRRQSLSLVERMHQLGI
jgi:hypothetical protein